MVRSPPKTSNPKVPKVLDYKKTQITEENAPPPGLYVVKAVAQLADGRFVWEIQDGPHKGQTFTSAIGGLPTTKSTIN